MIKRIINASAGTGKTFTILEEVLKTELKEKGDIKEIKKGLEESVFLSFSKAAVEEMKERIHARLSELGEKSKSVHEELSGLLAQRAYTIHSFSLELARLMRYELGLPAAVDFIPEGRSSVWEETVDDFYSVEFDRETLREKAGIKSPEENAVFDLLTILCGRESIRDFIREKGENVYFVSGLGGRVPETPSAAELKKTLEKAGFKTGAKFDYAAMKIKLQEFLYEKRRKMDLFEHEAAPYLKDLRECLEKTYKRKKDGTKSQYEINNDARVKELEAIVDPYMKDKEFLALFELCGMAGGVLAKVINYIGEQRYVPAMMEEGVFDFDAIVFLVIRLIKQKGRAWFLERMSEEGMEIKNLYMDEAQDSDIVQNYLISVLAGGDDSGINVTVVGDIKQSIYQWRNAYPEEFRAMYEEATALKRSQDLTMSWRVKNGENLKFINSVFGRMAEAAGGRWDYDKKRDELRPNKDKIDASLKKKIKIVRVFKDTDLSSLSKELEDFTKNGSCGILVEKKRYADCSGVVDALSNVKLRLNTGTKAGGAMPERMLLSSLLYTRLKDKLQYLPYILLFTTPGNLVRGKLREIKGAKDLIELVRKMKYFTEAAYETYRESGLAKSAYTLMDKYGLWEYMFHGTQDGPDKAGLAALRRAINSALASVHIAEQSGSNEIYTAEEMAAEALESDNGPFEWYGLPGASQAAGSRELATIHASKGLQYDSVIVLCDIMGRLKTDSDFKDKEYSYLYHADFKDVLTESPDVGVSYYPYFGSVPCKVIKHYYAEEDAPWKGGLEDYEKTISRFVSENMNVLYVALTRAKDGIVIVDMSRKSRHVKSADDFTLSSELSVITGGEPVEIDLPKKKEEAETQGETVYYALEEVKKEMAAAAKPQEISVRQLIKQKYRIKHSGNAGTYGVFDNMETGTLAHGYVQQALGASADLGRYPEEASKLTATQGLEGEALSIARSDATLKELEKLKHLIGKSEFRSEVPVWHIGKDGTLVKGVIDSLAVADGKVSVIEYKTIFDDEEAQKQLSEKQLEIYEGIIKNIAPGMKTETVSVMLRRG